ncbi:hypothetical protein [Streptomyces sp. NPDC054887]
MTDTTERADGLKTPAGRSGGSRRRGKMLLWRAALGAAYTGGGIGLTLVVKWVLGL